MSEEFSFTASDKNTLEKYLLDEIEKQVKKTLSNTISDIEEGKKNYLTYLELDGVFIEKSALTISEKEKAFQELEESSDLLKSKLKENIPQLILTIEFHVGVLKKHGAISYPLGKFAENLANEFKTIFDLEFSSYAETNNFCNILRHCFYSAQAISNKDSDVQRHAKNGLEAYRGNQNPQFNRTLKFEDKKKSIGEFWSKKKNK